MGHEDEVLRIAFVGPAGVGTSRLADECRQLDLVAMAEPIGLDLAEEIVGSDVLTHLDEAGVLGVTAGGHRVELQTVHPLYGRSAPPAAADPTAT